MIPALLLALSASFPGPAPAAPAAPAEREPDVVVLRDGTRLSGRIVAEDERRIVVRIGTKEREVERDQTTEVRSRLANWRETLQRWNELPEDDAAGLVDLARFALRLGLAEEARVFALLAVCADPEHAEAREMLGHEKKARDWFLREDGRRYAWQERVAKGAAWRDAWRLETTHWSLRTNLPLPEAAHAILDLENTYRIYFDEVAGIVGAHHLDRVLEARIHADDASFPDIAGGRGFYDRQARVLFVNAARGLDRGLLVHEALHDLLCETSVHVRGGRGAISPWLDEGLAEYFRATTHGPPGRLAYDATRIDTLAMRAQAQARNPYKLSRVMTFDSGEYLASSRQDLKYAQSYTFVHYLVAGDDGRHRPGFEDFLRSAWRGQGSSTDLERALGAKIDALDRAWSAWVAARAR